MTAHDICVAYEKAEDKRQAIRDIANNEFCGVQDIKDLLMLNGYELPPETRGRKPKKAVKETQGVKVSRNIPESVYLALCGQISSLESEIAELQKQINEKEKQYQEIADFIYGKEQG